MCGWGLSEAKPRDLHNTSGSCSLTARPAWPVAASGKVSIGPVSASGGPDRKRRVRPGTTTALNIPAEFGHATRLIGRD